ncbi:hypothetical protein C1645_813570 [Glomus cerebriforme]|uniref:Tyrosinase copper-binding domain-containing protein n=1 Tax=Glomus cerebriforme TaxID=658196 RepID=A0A397TSI1_9GLOM|nr:hypothetical protein C1645_813570 [Glomus cerebriforme]
MSNVRKGKSGKKISPDQNSINEFLKVPKNFRKDEARVKNFMGFTPFDPKQAKQAVELNSKFMKIANANPNDPIPKVLEFAKVESEKTDPELIRWALMSFITHHPAARSKSLRIPSLAQRAPDAAAPKKKKLPTAPGPIVSDKPTEAPDGDVELLFDWWREDPNFNEHHEHWHVVYQGVPDPNNPDVTINKDRHGELFIYMHRQMLARFDAERQALNVPLIKPLDDYRAPIPEGYKPNQNLVDTDDNNTTFGTREANAVLGDVGENITIEGMEKNRNDIEEAVKKGQFVDGTEITTNLFGAILEPSETDKQNLVDYYGGLHGNGHVALAYISNPSRANEEGVDPGVMYNPRVAARDPVFWRWHRHIDDLVYKWESKQQQNDFSKSPPPVKIREGDIILVFKDKLPINHGATQDDEATAFGEQTFGGNNFDTDVSNNEYVTHGLETKMKRRLWTYVEDSGASEEIEYLFPREFYYYFRVENTSSSPLNATFRVFLAPEELADSVRHWIELDKFKQELPPNSKTVVSRDCDMSSVIRQPPQKTEDELDDTVTQPGTEDDSAEQFCDCGWPFHLLLPRGRKGGAKYKLLVFITDWSQDEVPRLSRCGSISFCGAEGPAEKYPDSKPMGYPFDKPFKNNSYKETFAGLNNATIKDVTISWVDDFPEIVVEA